MYQLPADNFRQVKKVHPPIKIIIYLAELLDRLDIQIRLLFRFPNQRLFVRFPFFRRTTDQNKIFFAVFLPVNDKNLTVFD